MKIAEDDRDMLEYLNEACESQVYVCDQCGHEEALSTFDIASDLRDYMAAEQHQGDPGEVKRLQAGGMQMELDELRVKLAERDAMLREVLAGLWPSLPLAIKIKAALSASADPVAPTKLDELKPCPFCGCRVTLLTGSEDVRITGSHGKACPFLDLDVIVDGRDAWQARAALERKP